MSYSNHAETAGFLSTPDSQSTGTEDDLPSLVKPLAFPLLAVTHAAEVLYNGTVSLAQLDSWKVPEGKDLAQALYGNGFAKFYGDNETLIDTTGEIASLLVPGLGAAKIMSGLSKVAETSKLLKYYNVLDAAGYQRKYEGLIKTAAAGTEAFGDYTKVWSNARKAYLAGGVAAVQESAAISAFSYALLKDTNLYEDYSLKDFGVESLFGGAIGLGFKVFPIKSAAKNAIAEYEQGQNAANNFVGELKGFTPAQNLVNMFAQRDQAFTDQKAAAGFISQARATFRKLIPADEELHPALDVYAQTLAQKAATGDRTALVEVANLTAGLKRISSVAKEDAAAPTGGLRMYLDTESGNLTDAAVIGAAEKGITVGNGAVFVGKKKLEPKLFSSDIVKLDAADADGLHILAIQLGRSGKGFDIAPRMFAGKKFTQGFRSDNPFHLAAAREYADKNGGALLLKADGTTEAITDATKIAERQVILNDSLAARLAETGHTEEAIGLKLNADPLGGNFSSTRYAGRSEDDLVRPRFLEVEYDLADIGARDVAKAELFQTSLETVRRDRLTATVEKQLSDIGGKFTAFPENLNGTATTQDAPGFFGFGGQGVRGGFRNAAEQAGAAADAMGRQLSTKYLSLANSKLIPLLQDSKTKQQFAVYMNEVIARPPGVLIRQDPSGAAYLFDVNANDVLKNVRGEALPALEPKVLQAMQEYQKLHTEVARTHNAFRSFDGQESQLLKEEYLYFPQANNSQYFAVMDFKDTGAKRFINANSDADLSAKIAENQKAFGNNVVIKRKGDIKAAKEVEGLFDPAHFFQNIVADLSYERKGTSAVAIVGDGTEQVNRLLNYFDGFGRASAANYTARRYAGEISQLENQQKLLSSTFDSTKGKAPTSPLGRDDQFNRIKNVILGKTNVGSYEKFATANATANQLFAKGYEEFAKGFNKLAADGGIVGSALRKLSPGSLGARAYDLANSETAQYLNDFNKKFGLGANFENLTQQLVINSSHSPQAAQRLVTGMNGFFATGQLGLDVLNTAVNFLSYPLTNVPELSNLAKAVRAGSIQGVEDLVVKDPSVGNKFLLSPHKILEVAYDRFSNPTKYKEQWDKFVERGLVSPQTFEYQLAHEELGKSMGTRDAGVVSKAWTNFVGYARNHLVERPTNFMQFAAATQADEYLLRAGIVDEQLRNTIVSQHVKRVQHNFPGAQRPIAFNGPIGSAVSLYQTFQFNTIQNLVRYMGEKDNKAVALFMAIQSGTFGLQSNPAFHAANSMIAYRSGNNERNDLYTRLQDADGLLYGPISKNLGINLYSRGDLTPRTAILLPTEVSAIPAIAQSIKVGAALGSIVDGLSTAIPGGEPSRVYDSLLTAIQQSGLSRPLSGIAATLQGQTVDSTGNKIVDTELFSTATAIRAAGGRPFDEAKLRDLQYRTAAYQAKDNKLLEELGEDYRSQVRAHGDFDVGTWKNFVQRYTDSGGELKNLNRWLIRTNEKAGRDVATRLAKKYQNDPDMQPWLKWISSEAAGGLGQE